MNIIVYRLNFHSLDFNVQFLFFVSLILTLLGFAGILYFFIKKHRHIYQYSLVLKRQIIQEKLKTQSYCELLDRRITNLVRLTEIIQVHTSSLSVDIPAKIVSEYGIELFLYDLVNDINKGYYVEVGAGNGVVDSTTYLLESIGWKGVLIEPHPELAEECRVNRPNSKILQTAVISEEKEKQKEFSCIYGQYQNKRMSFLMSDELHYINCLRSGNAISYIETSNQYLQDIIESQNEVIEMLSIDTNGNELAILKSIKLNIYKPKLIVLAGNIPETSFDDYLKKQGYSLKTIINRFYFFTYT